MLLKVAASILIISACTFLGHVLASDLVKRLQELRQLQTLLHMLENEIRYMSNILTDAFEKITAGNSSGAGVFFSETAKILRDETGAGAPEAWKRAVEQCIGKTSLNREDEKVLLSFGSLLGSSDTEGQLKNIKIAAGQLEDRENEADEKRRKNEPMYKKLGVLTGIAIVILLY